LPVEREWLDKLLKKGYIDTFRHFFPDKKDMYTWWTYRFNARKKNIGWRIDYFFVTAGLIDRVKESSILSDITGSDHAPILLRIK
jgi:exodeoxyribonuclease-3